MKLLSFLRPLLEAAAFVTALVVGLRLITGLFGRKNRAYRPTFLRQFTLLFWPLLCLAVGLPFLGSFFYAGSLAAYELVLLTAVAAVVLGFSVPAFVLHARYYALNAATTLVFDPKQNVLEVYEQGVAVPFDKRDLARVEWVTCQSDRLFWSPYNYLRLHLHGGEIIILTSILSRLEPLTDFLRNTPLERRQRWFCWI